LLHHSTTKTPYSVCHILANTTTARFVEIRPLPTGSLLHVKAPVCPLLLAVRLALPISYSWTFKLITGKDDQHTAASARWLPILPLPMPHLPSTLYVTTELKWTQNGSLDSPLTNLNHLAARLEGAFPQPPDRKIFPRNGNPSTYTKRLPFITALLHVPGGGCM